MTEVKVPLHHRREYDQVSQQLQKLSGWWPMLTLFAVMCLVFVVSAPFATPPLPIWVRVLTTTGAVVFGGPAAYIFFKKRSLMNRLRKLT